MLYFSKRLSSLYLLSKYCGALHMMASLHLTTVSYYLDAIGRTSGSCQFELSYFAFPIISNSKSFPLDLPFSH